MASLSSVNAFLRGVAQSRRLLPPPLLRETAQQQQLCRIPFDIGDYSSAKATASLQLRTQGSCGHRWYSRFHQPRNSSAVSLPSLWRLPLNSECFGARIVSPQNYSHRGRRTMSHSNDDDTENNPILVFSSIKETPLDSVVIEKPYTIVLMEDDLSYLFTTNDDVDAYNNISTHHQAATFSESSNSEELLLSTTSWSETFRSKIPAEYGMSFASIVLTFRNHNCNKHKNSASPTSVSDGLQALKASELPGIGDAIVVARGPVSSLCVQYYLESFSLQGLVMIDPVLIDDTGVGDADGDVNQASSLVSRIYPRDDDDTERFRSSRLLVEPNAVPMMVISTVPNNESWNRSSRFVAARHGDHDGPYGAVPVVNLSSRTENPEKIDTAEDIKEALALQTIDRINEWIDEAL